MMKILKYFTLLLGLSFFSAQAFGQSSDDNHQLQVSIPEVALIDIEGTSGTSITLNVETPDEAGAAIDLTNSKDSSLWLNYSSIVGSQTEGRREIYAKISNGSVPKALQLRVVAATDAGNGDGFMGTPTNEKVLKGNDRRIIKNIRSAYTGNGVGSGHRLYYRLRLKNNKYNLLDFDESTTVTILYTITDS